MGVPPCGETTIYSVSSPQVPGTERLVIESCTLVILTGARMGSVELVKFERVMMQILGKF